MDNCPAASLEEISRCELPRASRRATAGKLGDIVPIGRGVHAGCGRASNASHRNRRLGARIGGGVVSSLYTPVLVAHVLVAVLGLGSIASIAVVAATARRVGRARWTVRRGSALC